MRVPTEHAESIGTNRSAYMAARHLESEVPAEDTILHNSLENLVVAIPFFFAIALKMQVEKVSFYCPHSQ